MHRYDWEPVSLVPSRVIGGIKALGVDVSNWGCVVSVQPGSGAVPVPVTTVSAGGRGCAAR